MKIVTPFRTKNMYTHLQIKQKVAKETKNKILAQVHEH